MTKEEPDIAPHWCEFDKNGRCKKCSNTIKKLFVTVAAVCPRCKEWIFEPKCPHCGHGVNP